MIINVYIETNKYEIDCDTGTQDIAWLAISACYLHGSDKYPVTRYIPCYAHNIDGRVLHPKLIIFKNEKLIGNCVFVRIRPALDDINELIEEESTWYKQAFTLERFMMDVLIK
jgi:hypothetical protein